MVERHFSLVVAYDGTDFSGWQRQPPPRQTVQGSLEVGLSRILDQTITVRGCGRTDAGVHSLGQWVAFSARSTRSLKDLHRGLHAVLPGSIRVVELREASRALDPMRESVRKTYFYQYHIGTYMPPMRYRSFAPSGPLDLSAMREASRHLEGRHDFRSFVNDADRYPSCERDLHRVRVLPVPQGVRMFFTAPGFLYNMVRTLASGLREVGRGQWSSADLLQRLQNPDRSSGPVTAPPQGLFLFRVERSVSAAESLGSPGAEIRRASSVGISEPVRSGIQR